jgi:hypothetical protein
MGITSHAPRSAKNVREWTPTFTNELPCWELESQMHFRIFRAWLQGSKPIASKNSYIIRKLLKCWCLKWACIAHFNIWSKSYGQKKGRESNWQFDSQTLKIGNRPEFVVCRWRTTYHWKALIEGYKFALHLITIGGLHKKLCTLKVTKVLVVRISRLPPGSPKTKSHLDVAFVESHKIYYKGEGCGLPPSLSRGESCESEVACGSFYHRKCSNYALTISCWFCASPCE